jgi:hypothetical protein
MFRSVYSVSLCCSVCKCVLYCTVQLPPAVSPIAVNKYIISQIRNQNAITHAALNAGGVADFELEFLTGSIPSGLRTHNSGEKGYSNLIVFH